MIEDVHFRPSYFSANDLAHKALQVNLSDIAAMGANPLYILCGIAIPKTRLAYANQFLLKLAQHCKKATLHLIGGDTVKSSDKLCISITVIGTGQSSHLKYRKNAKAGDIIYAAGKLGHAQLGLVALETSQPNLKSFKNALLRPTAKIQEGVWLGAHTAVTSMMDLSDGLFIDLTRLCRASRVGGNIMLQEISPSTAFKHACNALKQDPIQIMLAGGEDYGLLFTVKKQAALTIEQNFYKHFHYKLIKIGCITSTSGVIITNNGAVQQLNVQPFSHF